MYAGDHHVTRQLLDAVDRGEVDPRQLERLLVRHLQHSCETCQREIAAWRSSKLLGYHPGPPLSDFLRERVGPPAEEAKAQGELTELLALDPAEQHRRIRRANSRFATPRLAQLLLDEAFESLATDPDEAEQLVGVAVAVLDQTPGSAQADEAMARAYGMRAMVLKAQGDLDAAERQLRFVRSFQHEQGVAGLAICAELDEIEGSFRKDRRQLKRSEALLLRAISLYEAIGGLAAAARARLVLGLTQFFAGSLEDALATTKAALEHFDLHRQPNDFLRGRYNQTLFLTEMAQAATAAAQLNEDLPLYKEAAKSWPQLELHVHWLAGKIQRRLGHLDRAEKHLVRARQGFAKALGTQYDAIAVCLDLALVYMAQHRHEELAELAELMVTGFAADGLHQEALAAVSLAAEAARKRRLTEELAREVAHFLQFARNDPSLKLRG